jgi:hypothetical protein
MDSSARVNVFTADRSALSPSQLKYLSSRGASQDSERWKEKFRQQLFDRCRDLRFRETMARRKPRTDDSMDLDDERHKNGENQIGSVEDELAGLQEHQRKQLIDEAWADFLRREQLGFDNIAEDDYISFMNFVDEALHHGLMEAGMCLKELHFIFVEKYICRGFVAISCAAAKSRNSLLSFP